MTATRPPALATWLLKHAARGNDALITTLLTLTAGTASLMLISDQISRRQIGNGMFLVFVAGIVAGLSRTLGQADPFALLTYAVVQIAIVAVVSRGYRRALAPAGLG
jgi:preprotein translocase subunit SecY